MDATASSAEVMFEGASFSYPYLSGPALLRDATVRIANGKLAMVFGPVGSGNSNLINSILGDMQLASGSASVTGRMAYVPQKPWCQFGTLRDNILFGLPWDEARYRRVLHACALERDLDIMADGDLTEIGERGANISGGQAQRIVSSLLVVFVAGLESRTALLYESVPRLLHARRTATPTSSFSTLRSPLLISTH